MGIGSGDREGEGVIVHITALHGITWQEKGDADHGLAVGYVLQGQGKERK